MDRIGQLFARHRPSVALFVGLVTLVAFYGISQLKFDDDPRNLFKTGQADYLQLERQFEEFGSDDNDCVFVIEGKNLFQPATIEAIRQMVAQIRSVDGVEQVLSIFDAKRQGLARVQIPLIPKQGAPDDAFEAARQRALDHPLVAGQLLSADAETMLVIAKLDRKSEKLAQMEPVVSRLREIVEQTQEETGLRVRLTGVPPIRVEVIRHVEKDLVKFNVLGGVVALVIAFAVFRQFSAVLIVVAAPALGAVWLMGSLGLAGVSINVLNSVVPTLVLVVGLTDSVHFLLDIKRSRAERVTELDASVAAIHHVGVACGLTSLTSAVGFASLAVAQADIIRGFGLACAAGSLLTFLAVLTVVPLLASTRLSKHLGEHRDRERTAARWSNAVVHMSTNHPWAITALGIAATVLLGLVSLKLRPDSWLTENLPSRNESSLALQHCDEAFGGVMFVYALVEWPEGESLSSSNVHGALQDIHQLFNSHAETRGPLSVLNVVQSLPLAGRSWPACVRYLERGTESLSSMLRVDRRHALVSAHVRDLGGAKFLPVSVDLKSKLAEIEAKHPGLRLQLSGTSVVASENITGMIRDLGSSLGLESLVIFGIMTWSFRSLGLGLISIIPNVFPLVCVGGLMVALGMPLQFGSVIVFNICLGLAVDDTIHVMTKFNSELKTGGDVRSAIRRSFSSVGTAVLTTTAILLAGFAAVMLSDIPALRLFGGLSCVTILAALVGELVFTPALLLAFLGRKQSKPRPAESPILPLPLAPFEEYMLGDDRPGYPMNFFLRLQFSGQFNRSALQAALEDALARHPLLLAHVHRSGRRLWWAAATHARPTIAWLPQRPESSLPHAGPIDLYCETGVRMSVLEDEETSEIVLQSHHSCCDGRGIFAFIGDLLMSYARRMGDCSQATALPDLEPELLRTRAKFGLTPWRFLRIAHQQAVGLLGVRQFLSHVPAPLVRGQQMLRTEVSGDYPATLTQFLEAEELQGLRSAARQLDATRNDMLIRDLFLALRDWSAAGDDPTRWLRLSIPMNLRVDCDANMPAANVVSMIFLDRRPCDMAEPALLNSIREEMQQIKRLRLGLTFVLSLRFFRYLPGGLSRMTPGDRCLASSVLTNVGDALAHVSLPRQNGRIVAGNVVLETVEVVAPIRPFTNAVFAVLEYAGRLAIVTQYDSTLISKHEANELLTLYVQRLRQTGLSTAMVAQESCEEAT